MMQSVKVTLSLVAQCNCEFAHVIIPHDARCIVPLALIGKDYATASIPLSSSGSPSSQLL